MTSREKIGRYRVRKLLGKGGMGEVYLAHDPELQRDVAIKLIIPIDGRPVRARSLREARAAASIRHPNVATIHEIGDTDDGDTFIAMEYCEGRTLSSLIRGGRIDLGSFISIAKQIASGISAAHRAGVLHRDIKSANILVEDGGLVKILDFGLAKTFAAEPDDTTMAEAPTDSKLFGTMPYLSPEQAAGAEPDIRSDLFATGIVLYEMASGRLPFQAPNPLALLDKIRDAEPAPIESTSFPILPDLTRIIGKLLQKVPADRYQSADALLEDLEKVEKKLVTDENLSRETANYSLPSTRSKRHARWIVPVLSALAIVLAVFVAFSVTERRSGREIDPTTPISSIAVLPFHNLANTPEEDFLSVGLADALISSIQGAEGLRVRPTSSIIGYRGAGVDTLTAAKELEVDGLVTGSFFSGSGEEGNVRVSLQLVDTRSDEALWSHTLQGRREDLLDVIDTVTDQTIAALRRTGAVRSGGSGPESLTSVPAAYEHYVKARSLAGSLDPETLEEEIEELLAAIRLDPRFAAAYAHLSIATALAEVRGFDPGAELESPETYARRAVRLDPNLAAAHVALGRSLILQPGKLSESLRENLAALRLNPDEPQALAALISYFVSTGDTHRIGCVEERFVSIDPSSNVARTRGYWHINAVDAQKALDRARVALEDPATALAGHDIQALAALQLGRLELAREHQRAASELVDGHYIGISLAGMIAAAEGRSEPALQSIERFRETAESNHWAALRAGLIHARLGNTDDAVEWIEKARDLGNHSWYFLVRHPWLQPLQSHPGFQDVAESIRSELQGVRADALGMQELVCQSSASGSRS